LIKKECQKHQQPTK